MPNSDKLDSGVEVWLGICEGAGVRGLVPREAHSGSFHPLGPSYLYLAGRPLVSGGKFGGSGKF